MVVTSCIALHFLDVFQSGVLRSEKRDLGSTQAAVREVAAMLRRGRSYLGWVSKILLFLCHFYSCKKSCATFDICVVFLVIRALLFKNIWLNSS